MSIITTVTGESFLNLIQFNVTDLSVTAIITNVIVWIIYTATVLAFIFLVYAGILYIASGGNPEQAKKGQQGLIFAVIGILIVVLSFVILRAANFLGRGIL